MHHKHAGIGVLLALVTWGSVGLLSNIAGAGAFLSRVLTQSSADQVPWRIIAANEVADGVSVPVNTNVVFTMPKVISPSGGITRKALFGEVTDGTRYWGYCLPPDKAALAVKKDTLPGKMFLSDAERAARLKEWRSKLPKYSAFNPPTTAADAAKQTLAPPKGLIRDEKQVFYADEICYVTVGGKTPLNIGIDLDGDTLNSALERAYRTDPENADSDADGIMDGVEVLRGHTNPLTWDTDGDGIPDGTEDADRDGRRDEGETDPLNRDTDGDGLCDGECAFGSYPRICGTGSGATCVDGLASWSSGEDRNRNGTVDDGETDPRKAYTDGVTHDMERYLDCRFEGRTDC